jgi:DNA-binding LacI/PurR family transcriptional regulator
VPPLTTVRQDFGEVGRQALDVLIQQMAGDGPARALIQVAAELVIRASAAPPRA